MVYRSLGLVAAIEWQVSRSEQSAFDIPAIPICHQILENGATVMQNVMVRSRMTKHPGVDHRQSISGPNWILMASTGQSRRQEPQCQHSSGYLTAGIFCSSSKWMTSNGQWKSQIPHPLHLFRSMTGGTANLLIFHSGGMTS